MERRSKQRVKADNKEQRSVRTEWSGDQSIESKDQHSVRRPNKAIYVSQSLKSLVSCCH